MIHTTAEHAQTGDQKCIPLAEEKIMNVTELLVTGYDGNEPVFVVNLAPNVATTVLTSTTDNGEATVDATAEQASDVFARCRSCWKGWRSCL